MSTVGGAAASLMGEPSSDGRFGRYGGRFLTEALVPACLSLEAAFREAWADPSFHELFDSVLREYGGRPSPVTAGFVRSTSHPQCLTSPIGPFRSRSRTKRMVGA
jgi:hypothetical protein